jgi:hypothetical protein
MKYEEQMRIWMSEKLSEIGFLELARQDHSLADPVKKRPTRDARLARQLGGPAFIRQKPIMVPPSRPWRFHASLALQLRAGLGAKASGGTGKAKVSGGKCL